MPVATRLAAVLATITFCMACFGTPEPKPAGDIVLRWIQEDPERVLQTTDLYVLEPAFRWTFSQPTDIDAWTIRNVASAIPVDGHLQAELAGDDSQLIRSVDADASDLDGVEVEVMDFGDSMVSLLWAETGELFSGNRCMEDESTRRREGRTTTLYFDLRRHPGFRGSVGRLRLDPVVRSKAVFKLVSVTGMRRAVDSQRLADACSKGWKVELGYDLRNALLAPPGLTRDLKVSVPAGAVLSFAYGLLPGIDHPVQFAISATNNDGETQPLFSQTLDGHQANRWHGATVSLHDLAGTEVTLHLETSAREPFDVTRGVPVWSNPELTAEGRTTGPNVVLICLDTLRADRLSGYGYDLPTSPNIDAWARAKATTFQNVVATAPWTLPSHVSMFTGLEAMRHGVNYYGAAPNSLEMVAETMRRAGYTTAAFTGGGYLRPQFGFAQGFDRFSYWPHKNSEAELKTGVGHVLRWLDDHHRQPFFLFFHTYEVHFPHRRRQPYFDDLAARSGFDPPAGDISMRPHGWTGLINPGDYLVVRRPGTDTWVTSLDAGEKRLTNLMYDSAVAYTDTQIQKILDRLDELSLGDQTVVIVTSDHGEALGEDDRAGHSYLEDYNVMVPLMIALPTEARTVAHIDRQVRLTDLAPTLLAAAGVDSDRPTDGVSLLPLMVGQPSEVPAEAWTYSASNNRGLSLRLDNRLKYTLVNAAWTQIAGRESLFDLTSDPDERVDLSDSDPRAVELKNRVLGAVIDQHTGFRLTISNGGPHILRGRLGGALAGHARLKTADPDCGCVTWRKGKPPTIALPPGHHTRLLVESPEARHMSLTLWIAKPDGTRGHLSKHRFNFDDVESPVAWSFDGTGWNEVAQPLQPPRTGFLLTWHGERTRTTDTDPGDDDAVLEQLRALGYVE